MDFKLKKTIFVLMTIVLTFIMNPYSFAACNNADGKKVTLSVTGAVYVVAGSTNEYTLTFDPADVDTSGGTFNWTLPNEWSFVGETNAATVSVVVPAEEKKTRQTKGAGGDGKSEKQQFVVCSFDKEGWSGKTDCSASQAVKVVTLSLSSPKGEKVFKMGINPPSMPTNVVIKISVKPEIPGLKYKFVIGDSFEKGHLFFYKDAPSGYDDNLMTINTKWINESSVTLDFTTNICGGCCSNITVFLKKDEDVILTKSFTNRFYVVGDSLSKSVLNNYIDTLSCSNYLKKIIKVVAVQESGGTHFWSGKTDTGTASHVRYPKLAGNKDGGYGVMQLTDSKLVTAETIWNWQKNIDAAMGTISNRYDRAKAYLNTHPDKVTDDMIRLEVYERYNGGLNSHYYYWSSTASKWCSFGYIPCPGGKGHEGHGGTHGYRDYNNDGIKDPDGNPYNLPGVDGENICTYRATRYADQCLDMEE